MNKQAIPQGPVAQSATNAQQDASQEEVKQKGEEEKQGIQRERREAADHLEYLLKEGVKPEFGIAKSWLEETLQAYQRYREKSRKEMEALKETQQMRVDSIVKSHKDETAKLRQSHKE